jgi:RNA polymerase sigma factor (sigma-70 family)
MHSELKDDRQRETDRLLDAAKNGDTEAASSLLASLRPLIAGYLRPRTRSADDCDDLTQNVFLRASRNLTSFRGDCPFSQWLLRIAANELKNYYERTVPGRVATASLDFDWENSLGLQQPEINPGPYSEAEDRSLIEHLISSARQVCGQEESAVLIMFYQGESFEEIAGLMQMKAATVRSHFLRARGKLLAHLMVHDPPILGGAEAIRSAVDRARREGAIDEREAQAFGRFDARSEFCRAACVKVARYLPIPFALLFLGATWTS